MIYMNCDYNEGAHEQVLARIVQTNAEQQLCRERIRALAGGGIGRAAVSD